MTRLQVTSAIAIKLSQIPQPICFCQIVPQTVRHLTVKAKSRLFYQMVVFGKAGDKLWL